MGSTSLLIKLKVLGQGRKASGHFFMTLEFPELKGDPKSVKLVIKGVAGVPERPFKWIIGGWGIV